MKNSSIGPLAATRIIRTLIGALTFPLGLAGQELVNDSATLSIQETTQGAYRVGIVDPVQSSRTLEYELIPREAIPAEPGGDIPVILIPAKRIVSLSTTYIGPFDAIGALDQIIAVDNAEYIYTESLLAMKDAGELMEVGTTDNLDLETLLAAQPDLVILTQLNPSQRHLENRLRAAGIPVLITASWKETTPLGRSEWIKLFGILTGHKERAFTLYKQSKRQYEELKSLVLEADPPRPKVLLSAPFGGIWYMPGGASYTARFLEDAGAQSLWSDNDSTGSFPVDLESALAQGFTADFWLNPGRYGSLAELATSDPRFGALPVFQEGQVYNRNRRVSSSGANDYWESGSVYPDRVLADLVAIFHPELLPDHEFYYYQRLR